MIEALKLALEALESINKMVDYEGNDFRLEVEITAIKEALAQPEQEPVAYLSKKRQRLNIEIKPQTFVEIPTVTDWEMPLYMKPPQRTWEGLSVFEINDLVESTEYEDYQDLVERTEAKLKEKNI
jgi:hypothetical protein